MDDDPEVRRLMAEIDQSESIEGASLVPSHPPTMLPGRSALSWVRMLIRFGALAIVLEVPAFFGSMLADPGARHFWIGLSLGSALLAGLMACIVCAWGFALRRTAELRAGYTTLKRGYESYWQLDDKTGSVIRPPRNPSSLLG